MCTTVDNIYCYLNETQSTYLQMRRRVSEKLSYMLKANHIVIVTICLGPNSARSSFFSMTFNKIVKVRMESVVEEEKVKD